MADRLYELLPPVYRTRDLEEQKETLRAFLAVMENELNKVEADIRRRYDDTFIETCQEWLVPYIGDLLDVRPLRTYGNEAFSLRAYAANTLVYRRGKGTAAVLEQLARDITGWTARVVEFFLLLETNQNVNHVRPENHRTPDLRNTENMIWVDGPFDTAAHTADVRFLNSPQT